MLHFKSGDRLYGVQGVFSYRKCKGCGTIYQNPRIVAGDLPSIYPQDYYTHASPVESSLDLIENMSSSKWLPRFRGKLRGSVIATVRREPLPGLIGWAGRLLACSRMLRERAFLGIVVDEMLPRDKKRARALEIGCGAGRLLSSLKRIGWESEGVEWDQKAAEIARQVSGRPVLVGDFLQLELPQNSYDLVVLQHVLEHLPDTRATLYKVARILAPGGKAVLIYPNPESMGARLYHENWFPWEVPRHLVFPSMKALADVAAEAGLIPSRLRTTTRTASGFISLSSSYLHQKPVDSMMLFPDGIDQLLGSFERVLVFSGFDLGEEVIAVFTK